MRSFSLALGAALLVSALGAATPPPEVAVTSPTRGDIHRFVTLPGGIRANQQVTLHAKVAGHVKSIAVDRGDAVKKGQLLAELENPELAAERTQHEAELRVANAELARVKAAQAKAPDLITASAADTAKGRVDLATAQRARVDQLLRHGRIVAPFAGIVTARNVDVGAFVPAATAGANPASAAIVTVSDYAVVRVRANVPEVEAARVQPGQPVLVTTDSLPGKTFRGTVTRHAGALDEATRTLLVETDLPNADLALRPGMYAQVRIGVEKHTDAVLVPAAALVREKAAGFLFLLVDGKAQRVPVKYGFNDGSSVEILDGLPAGARVLIPGKVTLAAGMAVTAVEAK
jgi:membrane fusion protein (multidrug efflux system)